MIKYQDFELVYREFGIDCSRPVIVHSSLSAFSEVEDGAHTLIQALLSSFKTVIMPTFTYQTMLIPEVGPSGNALEYGSGTAQNWRAEFFHPDLSVHRSVGVVPETFRRHQNVRRTLHPILSFSGHNADTLLKNHTIELPLDPIRKLMQADGWVLLMGVDQRVNTSIHYAEQIAGRKQFTRWALTPGGVVECPRFPGCSQGFNALTPRLSSILKSELVGETWIQAIPLRELIQSVYELILKGPLALLCDEQSCQRCQIIRSAAVAS
ncbi:MAG: AAC(3) family N-acetyltransferase [Chloroflexota bacterium]|nr:AAC(3) family N-acetyltransferase [Chloroflexota bacterium]